MGAEHSKRGPNKELGVVPSTDEILRNGGQIGFGGVAGYAAGVAGRGGGCSSFI